MSVVSRSSGGEWRGEEECPGAVIWQVAVVELLSGKSSLELLVGSIQRPLPDDVPVVGSSG